MPSIRGVIFDMDGVLVDSEPLHGRAWEAVLRDFGIPCPEGWFERWIGIPDLELTEYLLKNHDIPMDFAALLAKKRHVYARVVDEELTSYPGVAEGLARLEGIPLAVATGSGRRDARQSLEKAGFTALFQAVVTSEDVERHKPAPDAYLRAAELLGLPPADCVAIEDSTAGVHSGKAAGCVVLGIVRGMGAHTLDEADIVFPTVAAALDWVVANLDKPRA